MTTPADISRKDLSRRAFMFRLLAGGLSVIIWDHESLLAETEDLGASPKHTRISPMEEGRPSETAQRAAMHRAAHQLLDSPKILDDPLALRIIGAEAESALRSNLEEFRIFRFLRAFLVLRSRYAEDELAKAMERGGRQYVILGAGLDTFAYRTSGLDPNLRIFEVDHPATQAWKRSRLSEVGIAAPDSLTFVPIDFEKQTLLDGLTSAGFNMNEPAFFSLLGVVVYLTKEAVMETFRSIASLSAGTEIVFDYPISSSSLTETQRLGREALAPRVAALGEPWISYFDPDVLAGELREMGYKYVEDFGPEQANDVYFKGRMDGLCISGSSHLMKARL